MCGKEGTARELATLKFCRPPAAATSYLNAQTCEEAKGRRDRDGRRENCCGGEVVRRAEKKRRGKFNDAYSSTRLRQYCIQRGYVGCVGRFSTARRLE